MLQSQFMRLKASLIAASLAAMLPGLAPAAAPSATGETDLFDLSLEELMEIEVSSVSKRAQPLSRTPAAVHVISAEQIRRSGAASIPEALRLAPGVHVARFSNNRWSVSIRGFG